ncbi:MAG: alanine--tRNA ligase [Bacilli bacterium]
MKKMTSTEIRNMWYSFFESKGHKRVESAPLVPIDDDSLLWINAGVTPLKKYFDGSVVPDNKRLVNVQKCIRTNDIENVGLTTRHQTFFEMMGNFSIGDYFKKEAISFAYELLTSEEWFAIPVDKLYITVYTNDLEAYNEWIASGVKADHLIKLDGNFWEIGEGPCGPDSEIFFDRGEKYDPNNDALSKLRADEDQDRYIEIWNNVFSQFNSKSGLKREEYQELPHKNIDTGAGLERWACIFQGVDSNFDTDLFVPIMSSIETVTGVLYDGSMPFKVIADHIRTITVALTDGAIFENVGRGYVLRRLLRRSVRMGKKLGITEPFMYKLVSTVVSIMKDSYPNLTAQESYVKTLVLDEEQLFFQTLTAGEKRLYELMAAASNKEISGAEAFKLYDTYGFPFELTLEYLSEKGFTTSKEEYDRYMANQKKLAKSSRHKENIMNLQNEALLNYTEPSQFLYQTYKSKGEVISLFEGGNSVTQTSTDGYVIMDKTCFYATSGGQVSDTGMLIGSNFKARVIDVTKAPHGQHIHQVKILDGVIKVGDKVDLLVDLERRNKIEANHSSVHLLQYALQQILSDKIHQAGSYVDAEGLRFDFTYTGKILEDEIIEVERQVNDIISGQFETHTDLMNLEDAKKSGAMALFSEKYGDKVRVVTIADSKELCGGTHVKNTRNIGCFAITNLESKGSNVYRVEAVTGDKIENALFQKIKPYNDEMIKLMMKAKNILALAKADHIFLEFDIIINNDSPKSYKDIIYNRNELEYIQNEVKILEKKYLSEKQKLVLNDLSKFRENKEEINGIKTIIMKIDNMDFNVLKEIVDNLLNELETGFIFLANIRGDEVDFLARSNINLNAGMVIKEATTKSDGNGGGSATFAQGRGKTIKYIDEIMASIKNSIKEIK